MFLFKGLFLIIKKLSFNSNANFLFTLVNTLKLSKDVDGYKVTSDH